MTTPAQISALPTAPSRSAPSTFSTRMDAFLAALATFVTEANALSTEVNSESTTATAQAVIATAQAVLSAASAATALAAANYKGAWSGLTGAATVPYSVSHLGKFWQLASNLADVTAKTPGTDAEWLEIDKYTVLLAKTGDATLSAIELGGNYVITNTGAGGAINLTLPAGAANYCAEFEVTAAQYLKITAAGAETFGYGSAAGSAGGYIRSNVVGTRWRITWNGSRWSVSNLIGTLKADE
jgi:hypothetical protein